MGATLSFLLLLPLSTFLTSPLLLFCSLGSEMGYYDCGNTALLRFSEFSEEESFFISSFFLSSPPDIA